MNKKGLAQIPLMIGLLIMAIAVPIATRLVQQNQENRGLAVGTECGGVYGTCPSGYYCSGGICKVVAVPPTTAPTCVGSGGSCATKGCCAGLNCFLGTCRSEIGPINPSVTPIPRICNPGATKCRDTNSVDVCNTNGTGWSILRTCAYGCLNGDCKAAPPTNTPVPSCRNAGQACNTSDHLCCSGQNIKCESAICCVTNGNTAPNKDYCCSRNMIQGKCAQGCEAKVVDKGLCGGAYAAGKFCAANERSETYMFADCSSVIRCVVDNAICSAGCLGDGSCLQSGSKCCNSSKGDNTCSTGVRCVAPTATPTQIKCRPLGNPCDINNPCCSPNRCSGSYGGFCKVPPTNTPTPCGEDGDYCTGQSCCSGFTCTLNECYAMPTNTPTPGGPIIPIATNTPPVGNKCPGAEACPDPNNGNKLRNCTPADSDGTPNDSLCTTIGTIKPCGGKNYCCPSVGGAWTNDMTKCPTICKIKTGAYTLNDFSIWRSEFVDGGFGTESRNTWSADFDCDGKVTLNDFSVWRTNFINGLLNN